MSTSSTSVTAAARRIVVKVGSSLVTNEGRGLDEAAIGEWCRQMAELVRQGREVIMVSSGAIAEGMKRLGWATRPNEIHELQAAAAVGQMGLAQMYETKLRENGMGSAQVLLTHADLIARSQQVATAVTDLSVPYDGWVDLAGRSGLRVCVAPMFRSANWLVPEGRALDYAWDEKAGPRMRGHDISWTRGMEILGKAHVTPAWDDAQKATFAAWDEKGVFQYVWLEDARAFTAKLDLVRAYGLRGYSVWKLGDEDPKTWEMIK